MKQEDKDLLFKDLSARLPYGVKASTKVGGDITITFMGDYDVVIDVDDDSYDISFITPYLFPLSSMTKEQKEEHKDLLDNQYSFDANGNIFTLQDFYCKYHLDYRGLIPMGLANDATGLNIY